jgi:hypothetical protein
MLPPVAVWCARVVLARHEAPSGGGAICAALSSPPRAEARREPQPTTPPLAPSRWGVALSWFAPLCPLVVATTALLLTRGRGEGAFEGHSPGNEFRGSGDQAELEVQVVAGEQSQRRSGGGTRWAPLGSQLIVEARLEGREGELRVYRDQRELVLHCPGDYTCHEALERGHKTLRGELTLEPAGLYRPALLTARECGHPRAAKMPISRRPRPPGRSSRSSPRWTSGEELRRCAPGGH